MSAPAREFVVDEKDAFVRRIRRGNCEIGKYVSRDRFGRVRVIVRKDAGATQYENTAESQVSFHGFKEGQGKRRRRSWACRVES
jgi:hypothetical protein